MTRPSAIVALMIGELDYMRTLNRISTQIVVRAVDEWRARPGSMLICESAPMTQVAVRAGVQTGAVVTALPQPRGHRTHLVARWLADSPYAAGTVCLVTHEMHAARAVKIFATAGITADTIGLDLPFDRNDPDWKLRTGGIFRLYNIAAHAYCAGRGWL